MDIQDISSIINNIFSNLFSSIDNNLYLILDEITFISSDILNDSHFEKILGSQTSSGTILICNALVIGFVLYHFITSIFSNITFNKPLNHSKFILRLIIFTILMNFSPFICSLILDFNSMISLSIRNIGEILFDKSICFTTLIQDMNSNIYIDSESLNVFSLDGIIKAFISISLLNLVFSYSLRYILIKLLILISPFAILCLISEKTAWFFSSWIKAFLSLLFVQIIVSLILLLIFSLNLSFDDLFNKLLLLGSIYALVRANGFIKDLIGGISSDVSINLTNFFRR